MLKTRIFLAFVAVLIITFASVAQHDHKAPEQAKTQSPHTVVTPDSVKWSATGANQAFAVVSGSPFTEGAPFVIRLKFADGAKIAPHWHPVDEHLTVIQGTFYMGMGEKFDASKAEAMTVGSYGLLPKEMRHFAWAKGETIIQIHGIGPFTTFWVNPPEKKD